MLTDIKTHSVINSSTNQVQFTGMLDECKLEVIRLNSVFGLNTFFVEELENIDI